MDNRRLLLLMIFFLSVGLLWNNWQKYTQPQPAPAVATAAPGTPVPSSATQAPPSAGAPTQAAASGSGELVNIRTDQLVATVSTLGGSLVRLELLHHLQTEDKTKNFLLFDAEHQYVAQSGLMGEDLPTHQTLFTLVKGETELQAGKDTLVIRLEAPAVNGVKATKVLTFHRASYQIDVAWEIENAGSKTLQPFAYYQLQRDEVAPGGEARMVSTFVGPAVYTEAGKYQKVEISDIVKDKAKFEKSSGDGWLAMVQHYFVAAWVPPASIKREFYMRKADSANKNNVVQAGVITPLGTVAPGAKATTGVVLYAGPQEQATLKKIANGLDLVVDYGWLTVVAAPIFWLLEWIHMGVGNWGWSIVVLTILIKLAFFPLSAASYRSMAKMRVLAPQMQALKERFGEDRQGLNQEMMKLYQREKINPLGGCLPILVQIPVFMALYWVLLGAVEMRGAPWLLWIADLSTADPYYVLPVIMMASMLIQTKLNPTPPDPIQAKMMMIMPFVFGVMFFFFPSGLVLYWVVNNILSIAQQWQITRMTESAKPEAAKAKS